ncbi:acyltransferase family protein [Tamlana sp. 62-3]|uniref:Acyltransferase family protein n=1 Tax=Neotamlana sargassicola TaxID=2883125 RepID=A0A9X1I9A5_9FLAO|nr:acyltransferase family protein [Tamlana sargassicola]MCB4809125.1 acyltransferase family protein [Tamlana sargassicola]
MKKKRKSNIELLRIVLMLMIISHHIIVHGLGLKNITSEDFINTKLTYIEILLNSFFVMGVNGFVFISGYFGIKFKIKRILSIIVQAISYSVILYLGLCLINKVDFDFFSLSKAFFPISRNIWWFITTYIGLYFIAPFLNSGMKNLKKTELIYILVGLFILNCFSSFAFGGISKSGYHLFNFIFLYLIGRFIRQTEINIKHPKLIFLSCSFTISLLGFIFIGINKTPFVWRLFYYNNPILILSAISLFFVFFNFKIGYNKQINIIAQLVLGVYMIHDFPNVRNFIASIVNFFEKNYNLALLPLLLLTLILSIFIISSLIEYIRFYLYNSFYNKINDSLEIDQLKSKLITFANNVHKTFVA